MAMTTDRDTLIYPSVLASTVPGDPQGRANEAPAFVEFVTNNQDTVVRGYVYWYMPEEGEPVLVVEIDDEDTGPDTMDITVRVRRNDGLVYEGTRKSQENLEEGGE
jgi:hypothetical protein